MLRRCCQNLFVLRMRSFEASCLSFSTRREAADLLIAASRQLCRLLHGAGSFTFLAAVHAVVTSMEAATGKKRPAGEVRLVLYVNGCRTVERLVVSDWESWALAGRSGAALWGDGGRGLLGQPFLRAWGSR